MPTTHTVEQGETILGIAKKYGFFNWEDIYGHPDNEDLRNLRRDPFTLYPGDKVIIPDKKALEFTCETGKEHVFEVEELLNATFRMVLEDDRGIPYADCNYRLEVDGEEFPIEKTDSKGMVEKEVPPDAKDAKLTLWPDPDDDEYTLDWEVQLGHLDPIETESGVCARLNNLGYIASDPENIDKELFSGAIYMFQKDHNLTTTGEIDDYTIEALLKEHGA